MSWRERLAKRKNQSAAAGGKNTTTATTKPMSWKDRLAARQKQKEKDEAAKPLLSTLSPLRNSGPESRFNSSPTRSSRFDMALQATMSKARLNRLGLVADPQSDRVPEIHLIGEIVSGTGFGDCVSCKWKLSSGPEWKCLSGAEAGHTQFDSPSGVENSGGGNIFGITVVASAFLTVLIMTLSDDYRPTSLLTIYFVCVCLFAFFMNNSNRTIDSPMENAAVWDHPIDVHYTTGTLEGFPRLIVNVWSLDDHGSASLEAYGFCSIPIASGNYKLSCKTWRPTGTSQEEITRAFIHAGPQLKTDGAIFERFADDRVRLTTVGSGEVEINMSVVLRNIEEERLDVPRKHMK